MELKQAIKILEYYRSVVRISKTENEAIDVILKEVKRSLPTNPHKVTTKNDMDINESNFRLIKYWSDSHKRQLKREFDRNLEIIEGANKRNKQILTELESLDQESEKIAELELESEIKFLREIERKCKRCGRVFDKRKLKSEQLCESCFTSNA